MSKAANSRPQSSPNTKRPSKRDRLCASVITFWPQSAGQMRCSEFTMPAACNYLRYLRITPSVLPFIN
jgi:hypothetical protein